MADQYVLPPEKSAHVLGSRRRRAAVRRRTPGWRRPRGVARAAAGSTTTRPGTSSTTGVRHDRVPGQAAAPQRLTSSLRTARHSSGARGFDPGARRLDADVVSADRVLLADGDALADDGDAAGADRVAGRGPVRGRRRPARRPGRPRSCPGCVPDHRVAADPDARAGSPSPRPGAGADPHVSDDHRPVHVRAGDDRAGADDRVVGDAALDELRRRQRRREAQDRPVPVVEVEDRVAPRPDPCAPRGRRPACRRRASSRGPGRSRRAPRCGRSRRRARCPGSRSTG